MGKQAVKHTPKPWKVEWDRYGNSSDVCGGDGEICEPICIIPHDDITTKGEKEMKANAKLITAAPELLTALVDLMKIADPDGDSTDIWAVAARAAIAKAA